MPNRSIKQLHITATFHNKSLYTPAGQQTSATACCTCLDSNIGNASKKDPCDYHSQKKDNWSCLQKSSGELPAVVCWLRLLLQVVVGTFLSALCKLLCLPSEIDLLRILHGTVRQNKNLSGQLLGNCRQYAQWLQFAVSTVMPCNWTRWTFGLILI